MARRARRNTFGHVISEGTATAPRFSIRWHEGTTKRRKSGFPSRTAALEALARIRVGLSDGTLVEKRKALVSFSAAAKEWLTLHSAPNLRSHQDNVERVDLHLTPVFGDTPLTAVTPTRILELRAKLQGKGLAPRTVNLCLALLRSILKFAVVNGHLTASPTDRIGRGRLLLPVEKAQLEPPIGKAADVGRLLAALRELGEKRNRLELYPLFSLLVFTGARRGEALGLRWSDVDLERRLAVVRRSYDSTTKSGKHRTVPLATALVTILREWRLQMPRPSELVFPNPETGEMFTRDAKLQALLREALALAGLPSLRVHDLRHTFASHFAMNGGDLVTLQRILGHSTPVLTASTYAHLLPSHLVAESDRVKFPMPCEPGKVLRLSDAAAAQV